MADEEGFPSNEENEFPVDSEPSKHESENEETIETYKLSKGEKAETRMNLLVKRVQDTYFLTQDHAIMMLIYSKWNFDKLSELLFNDDMIDKQKELSGIPLTTDKTISARCLICDEKLTPSHTTTLPCGHSACTGCCIEYITHYINDKSCVYLQCWKCKCKIPYSIYNLLPPDFFQKYIKWLTKSYTEESKTIKWCPNEKCVYFVEYPDMTKIDIKCICGCLFCFKCGFNSHKPCSCKKRKAWDQKNSSEKEDITWIMANTKPCPHCHKYIEKNEGCNHMTCRECSYQFCWICFEKWETHGSSYYNCIKFKDNIPTEGIQKEMFDKAGAAASELNKYVFYFDRYNMQHKSLGFALKEKEEAIKFGICFCERFKFHLSEIQFINSAFDAVIEARRILENTYIKLYYQKSEEDKCIIEYFLERLQFYCDQLHELSIIKKNEFLIEDDHVKFFQYKNGIIGKTSLVKSAFNNFMKGFENGFKSTK